MMIEVSTSEYKFAHGKRPRSEGTWVFFFDRVTEPFFVNGSYSERKKRPSNSRRSEAISGSLSDRKHRIAGQPDFRDD